MPPRLPRPPRSAALLRAIVALAALLLHALPAAAQTLKVLTAGAFKQVVLELVPRFEAAAGVKVEVANDTAGGLVRRISDGEAFDVVFAPPAGLATLVERGRVEASSVRPVARVGIGVAVRADAPAPPLETVEQFRAAVLAARRVAYVDPAAGGSSGIYLDGLFGRWGIADAVRAKAVLVPGGYAAERVARGEADLAIQQVSEILPVAGVRLAGMLPEPIQNYTTYAVGVATATREPAAAAAFAAAAVAPQADAIVRAKGMVPTR